LPIPRPGGGFVFVVCTAIGTAAFFSWGLSTPPLDDAWRLQVELAVGRRGPLDDRELLLLEEVLSRHPKIADNWLEGRDVGLISANREGTVDVGYAYVVRVKPVSTRVSLSASGRKAGDPITIRGRAGGTRLEGEAWAGHPITWDLPPPRRLPEIVEIEIGKAKRGRKATAVTIEVVQGSR
jgi:hypothetical protein